MYNRFKSYVYFKRFKKLQQKVVMCKHPLWVSIAKEILMRDVSYNTDNDEINISAAICC